MIRGVCHTNLDSHRHAVWPTEFVTVPEIGSSVESNGGTVLKVVSITHSMLAVKHYKNIDRVTITHEPGIKIELNRNHE